MTTKEKQMEEVKHRLANWQLEDNDYCDDVHHYFENSSVYYWPDVADEARVLWNTMFGDELEDSSPIDAIVTGVAAQAADGVWQTFATAFGLNKKLVESTLADWYEDYSGHDKPPPITYDEFTVLYEESKAWYEQNKIPVE